MATTYLDLTNKLLNRLLETKLTDTNFASATSTQEAAKQCILASISEIYSREERWPFAYKEWTQNLVTGTTQYEFPDSGDGYPTNAVDWDTFQIVKDDTLNVMTTTLTTISNDEWYRRYKSLDDDAGVDGRGIPQFVFKSNGPVPGASNVGGFGITPSPDKNYQIKFGIYTQFDILDLHSDTTLIPTRFDYVIINGALKNFYMFKDNSEQADRWGNEFDKTLNYMRHNLILRNDNMFDTRVTFGQGINR